MGKNIKTLAVFIISVLLIVVVVDLAIGGFFRWYVKNYDLGGDYTSFDHIFQNFDEDGLVIGSSVALNSLDTKLMSDSLGIEFFNGAYNAQDLPFALTVLETAIAHHKPKMVLLGMRINELSGEGQGNRYNFLTPYYGMGNQSINEGLEKISPQNKYFLKSNLYRYNTIWFRILLYRFIKPNEQGENGFIAKPIPSQYPTKTVYEYNTSEATKERQEEFERIIDICRDNDIELQVYFPPIYEDHPHISKTEHIVDSICKARGITLHNDLRDQTYALDSTQFYDGIHLNLNGAKKYTTQYINYLRHENEK